MADLLHRFWAVRYCVRMHKGECSQPLCILSRYPQPTVLCYNKSLKERHREE